MTEIKILDKSVFNRIAAGEVVDKPASIVKELIENSIDAGATSISIEITGGGVDYIRVSDNGKGIAYDDVKTAFMPHATSKIRSISDLDGISTLGFRGEALPSIASVAKVTVLTKPANATIGCRYVVDNGNECDFGEMGAPDGTTVTVENLFERIPARKKFLAKSSVEENAITTLVSKYILAKYNVAFRYTVNGKNIYSSTGMGLESAIKTVYNDEYLQNSIKINSTMSDINLHGYINKPAFTKHSRSFQTLIVNGRYVVNDDISYTIFGCYQKYLMKRQYPTYVLHLNLPYDLVDVNVHPNKLQVKFAMPGLIKKIIVDAINEQVLNSVSAAKSISGFVPNFFDLPQTNKNAIDTTADDLPFDVDTAPFIVSSTATQSTFEPNSEPAKKVTVTSDALGEIDYPASVKIKSNFSEWNDSRLEEPREDSFSDILADISPSISADSTLSTRVVGKLFNTYIIIESSNDIFLIDQHAAHEKILFDKYVSEFERGCIALQKMLIPYEFTVSHDESEVIISNLQLLNSLGFEIVQEKPAAFSLKSIPLCCVGLNVKNFISDFLDIKSGSRFSMMPDAFRSLVMQSACKAAAKGEDDLSDIEINSLLEQMSQNTTELFCPHGRPVVVKITRSEVEKWFKRIV